MEFFYNSKFEINNEFFNESNIELNLENVTNDEYLRVYKIEAGGLELFEYVEGDKDSIMGLPIKEIINYIKQLKK